MYFPVVMNTNNEVMMRKYAVALDPVKVSEMRQVARRTAVNEGRDVTWVGLLRQVMNKFLNEVRAAETNAVRGTNGGSR